jgi:hypothetical protein
MLVGWWRCGLLTGGGRKVAVMNCVVLAWPWITPVIAFLNRKVKKLYTKIRVAKPVVRMQGGRSRLEAAAPNTAAGSPAKPSWRRGRRSAGG